MSRSIVLWLEKQQVQSEEQPDQGQCCGKKAGEGDAEPPSEVPGVEGVQATAVAPGGVDVDYHPEDDKGDPHGEGEIHRCRFSLWVLGVVSEDEGEPGGYEAKAHEGKTGAQPGEEGSLCGEVDAGIMLVWRRHVRVIQLPRARRKPRCSSSAAEPSEIATPVTQGQVAVLKNCGSVTFPKSGKALKTGCSQGNSAT